MLTLVLALSIAAAPAERCVLLVGNSDLHGSIEPHILEANGAKLRYGGLLAMAAYLEVLRKQHGERLLLLDAGDAFQGSMVSNLSRGSVVLSAYNALGVDALVIGNHEFDFGARRADDPDRRGVLKDLAAAARFPFLSINIYEAATHRRVNWPNSPPSTLLDAGGIKVGVIGVTGTDTPKVTKVVNIRDLEFRDPVPLVIAEARQLRSKGAELVVALVHMGGRCDDLSNPNDAKSCEREHDLVRFVLALPPGTVDVAIGGHTHMLVGHWLNGIATVQAAARGKQLSRVHACVAAGGGIDRDKSRIEPPLDLCLDEWQSGGCRWSKQAGATRPAQLAGMPIEIPASVQQALQPFLDEVAAKQARPIGATLPAPLGRSGDRALGELIAESLRLSAGAQVGVQNLGGVRADLPAGRITYGHVYEVLPFDNVVASVELTGAQLRRFVMQLVERRGGPPYLAGLEMLQKGGAWELQIGGKPLDDAAHYKVATNDFLLQGGEGLGPLFDETPPEARLVTDVDMRDALIALLRQRFPAG